MTERTIYKVQNTTERTVTAIIIPDPQESFQLPNTL